MKELLIQYIEFFEDEDIFSLFLIHFVFTVLFILLAYLTIMSYGLLFIPIILVLVLKFKSAQILKFLKKEKNPLDKK